MSETVKKDVVKETAAKTTKVSATSKKKEKETVMYVGPAVPGVVAYGTIYNNGLPDAVKEKVKEIPVFGQLFVEVSKIGEAKTQLQNKNSALSACYEKLVEAMNNEKEAE